jgi:hypothetical protein
MSLIAQFTTLKPEMAHSRTYEDFYKFLGAAPERLGIVSTMYPEFTASFLTEGMGNIVYNKKDPGNKFQPINSLMFEWNIDVNFIKRVPFAAVPVGDGSNGSEIIMAFSERYYEKYDVFVIEGSKQQCFVVAAPFRKSDNYWEYTVRLMDSSYSTVLDDSWCQVGMETRFLYCAMPEYHEMGFAKFQSNIEKHRNWITEHRVDIDYSSRYALTEETFVKIANGEEGGKYREVIFKMPKVNQLLLENFMQIRNNALLWSKTTMDENGKSTIQDSEGRPIIAGDGAIPQINRFASYYNYSKLTVAVFNKAITTLANKAATPSGNTFIFVVNEQLYADAQLALAEFLNQYKVLTPALFSQKDGKEVEVGTEYTAYNFMGNKVVFKVDRALSREYPNKGYGILIDLTGDKASGTSAISMFTLKGAEFTSNTLAGVGGLDGKTSGPVASPVAGSKLINSGFAGIGVFTPYRSFVLLQA